MDIKQPKSRLASPDGMVGMVKERETAAWPAVTSIRDPV
jgi:hypothetical protein